MATDTTDDREMREAQRDYLDFLDDDVSDASPPVRKHQQQRTFMCSYEKACGLIM